MIFELSESPSVFEIHQNPLSVVETSTQTVVFEVSGLGLSVNEDFAIIEEPVELELTVTQAILEVTPAPSVVTIELTDVITEIIEVCMGPPGPPGPPGSTNQYNTTNIQPADTVILDTLSLEQYRTSKWIVQVFDDTDDKYRGMEVIATVKDSASAVDYKKYGRVGDKLAIKVSVRVTATDMEIALENLTTNILRASVLRLGLLLH